MAAFLLLQGLPSCLVTSCHSFSQEVLPRVLEISLTSHSGVGSPACAWQPWSSGLQIPDVENWGDRLSCLSHEQHFCLADLW